MLTFQIIGFVMSGLFFGAMVPSNHSALRRD